MVFWNSAGFSLFFANVNASSPLTGIIRVFGHVGCDLLRNHPWPAMYCALRTVKCREKSRMRTTYPKKTVWDSGFFRACAFLAKTPKSYGFFWQCKRYVFWIFGFCQCKWAYSWTFVKLGYILVVLQSMCKVGKIIKQFLHGYRKCGYLMHVNNMHSFYPGYSSALHMHIKMFHGCQNVKYHIHDLAVLHNDGIWLHCSSLSCHTLTKGCKSHITQIWASCGLDWICMFYF